MGSLITGHYTEAGTDEQVAAAARQSTQQGLFTQRQAAYAKFFQDTFVLQDRVVDCYQHFAFDPGERLTDDALTKLQSDEYSLLTAQLVDVLTMQMLGSPRWLVDEAVQLSTVYIQFDHTLGQWIDAWQAGRIADKDRWLYDRPPPQLSSYADEALRQFIFWVQQDMRILES